MFIRSGMPGQRRIHGRRDVPKGATFARVSSIVDGQRHGHHTSFASFRCAPALRVLRVLRANQKLALDSLPVQRL